MVLLLLLLVLLKEHVCGDNLGRIFQEAWNKPNQQIPHIIYPRDLHASHGGGVDVPHGLRLSVEIIEATKKAALQPPSATLASNANKNIH